VAKKPLSEQVVVVTGASSGLGRAIARGAGGAAAAAGAAVARELVRSR
jgi:NAD(P)-dependent dehydrogenase (short-subunit alcohol dehydrogenase family)